MTTKVISASDILDRLTELLKKQWPRGGGFRMPYCSLTEDPITKDRFFRVEIAYRRKPEDWAETHAIARVESESGSVLFFRDGANWT